MPIFCFDWILIMPKFNFWVQIHAVEWYVLNCECQPFWAFGKAIGGGQSFGQNYLWWSEGQSSTISICLCFAFVGYQNKIFNEKFTNYDRKIAPALLLDIPQDSVIVSEEIFGPLLPIITICMRIFSSIFFFGHYLCLLILNNATEWIVNDCFL